MHNAQIWAASVLIGLQPTPTHKAYEGYSLNRSCPAQSVALGRSDLAELNPRPGPMTFSYRSCSAYVNSPEAYTDRGDDGRSPRSVTSECPARDPGRIGAGRHGPGRGRSPGWRAGAGYLAGPAAGPGAVSARGRPGLRRAAPCPAATAPGCCL